MLATVVVSPFIFVTSTKFLTIASYVGIISIIAFIVITGYDATRSVTSKSFSEINYGINFGTLPVVDALQAFPVLYLAFTF